MADKGYNEVYDIISNSKQDIQVELVVARTIAGPLGGNTSSSSNSRSYLNIRKDCRRPSVTVTSPTSPDPSRLPRFGPVHHGKIQLKLWFDPLLHQLSVTVLRAVDLISNHNPPNPFAKLCLLPDRRLLMI